jgi:hypothetical protein
MLAGTSGAVAPGSTRSRATTWAQETDVGGLRIDGDRLAIVLPANDIRWAAVFDSASRVAHPVSRRSTPA